MMDIANLNIQELRKALYQGQGYVVIRAAVPAETIDHIQTFWLKEDYFNFRKYFNKYLNIRLNGADISLKKSNQVVHYNCFWNQPRDIVTYNLAWQLQSLRNKIEGQPTDWGYLPNYTTPGEQKNLRYVSTYRMVFTQQATPVPMHCDWDLDHSKIQVSLMLTSYQKDYTGGGLIMADRFRGGSPVNVCEKEVLKAGDLLLFRYAHPHGVEAVKTKAGGKGFGRMLMPLEVINMHDQSGMGKLKRQFKILSLKTKGKIMGKKPNFQRILTRKKRLVRGQGEALYYDDEMAKMMGLAIREGLSPAHVYLYRGLWGRFRLFQNWQMEVLLKHGLQPHHNFLDVGCGIMRLGLKLVPYLEDGRYCGIDPVASYIKLGDIYLQELLNTSKTYQLLISSQFEFEKFGRTFDFSMAQSVFTHLSFSQIKACFVALKRVMKPGSKFLFTILLNKNKEQNFLYIEDRPLTKSSHSNLSFYDTLAQQIGFEFRYLGKENHPTQEVCLAIF